MATVDATKLTAVNEVLEGARLASVASLGATRAATQAEEVLDRVNENVQSEEWLFNREFDVELTPVAGEITVGTNVLQVVSRSYGPRFTVRDGKLYDLDANSDSDWTGPVRVDLIRFLDLDELPPAARRYIVAKAKRRFSQNRLGNDRLAAELAAREETEARAALMNHEVRTGGMSALYNWPAGRVIFDRGQPLLPRV